MVAVKDAGVAGVIAEAGEGDVLFADEKRVAGPVEDMLPLEEAIDADESAREDDAFGYFRELTPVARVGHSIYVYEVTGEDCARLAPRLARPRL